jgi:hypothetical protein
MINTISDGLSFVKRSFEIFTKDNTKRINLGLSRRIANPGDLQARRQGIPVPLLLK